jgi:hypothetical protein
MQVCGVNSQQHKMSAGFARGSTLEQLDKTHLPPMEPLYDALPYVTPKLLGKPRESCDPLG